MNCVMTSWSLALALVLGQAPPPASGIGPAAPAFDKLINDCLAGGGLRRAERPSKGHSIFSQGGLEVADRAKLRAVLSAQPGAFDPAVRDALLALWGDAVWDDRVVLSALLRSGGEAARDDKALAWAALYIGQGHERRGELRQAASEFEQAASFFQRLMAPAMEATSLAHLGRVLKTSGEFGKALKACRQSLAVLEKAPGDHRPEIAQDLLEIGTIYARLTQEDNALTHFRRALDLFRALHPKSDHPSIAIALNNLGEVYARQGNLDKALESFRNALEIHRKVHGDKPHTDTSTCLGNIGMIYSRKEDLAEALRYHRQALDMERQLHKEPHADLAVALDNVADILVTKGDLDAAEPLLREALQVLRQVCVGRPDPQLATVLNNLGDLSFQQGDYAQSVDFNLQALQMRLQLFGPDHPDIAESCSNLALACERRGETARALAYGQRAQEVLRKAGKTDGPEMATVLSNLGHIYETCGEIDRAIRAHQASLALWVRGNGDANPDVAIALNNLGGLYDEKGSPEEALRCFRRALPIVKRFRGDQHDDVASVLNSIGKTRSRAEDYDRALAAFEESLAIRRKALPRRHPFVAVTWFNIGSTRRKQGEYRKALAALDQALDALRTPADAPELPRERLRAKDLQPLLTTLTVLAERARVLEDSARGVEQAAGLRAAARDYELALDLLDRQRFGVLEAEESKVLLGEQAIELFPRLIGVYRQLYDLEGRADDLEAAWRTAERGTARVFLQTLGRSRAPTLGGVDAAMRSEEQKLRRDLARIEALVRQEEARSVETRDVQHIGELRDDLRRRAEDLDRLVERIHKKYPHYAELQSPRPCTLQEARACLGKGEVALLFVPGKDRSEVVLLDGSAPPDDKGRGLALFALEGQQKLEDRIAALVDPDTLGLADAAVEEGKTAYDLLLGPLADRIRGKDLVIVPGGSLCFLPFELLVEAGTGKYLVEVRRVRYAPSLTTLHLVRRWEATRPRPDQPLWAAGDPVYAADDPRLRGVEDVRRASGEAVAEYLSRAGGRKDGFARLRFSGEEVKQVRQVLGAPEEQIVTGLSASEAMVKAASARGLLARARYVHFATHGVLGSDRSLQPSLVLSLIGNDGRNEGGGANDGFLQFDEVTNLRLNADLVVLSACQTGRGKLHAGEGVTGLARAFLYAGSRGIVCSLWPVDDRRTALLMKSMYTRLNKGEPAADALRAAQRELLDRGLPPLYWAPFILIGE
jgi:CHAT domain-containing protein/Tfp pilus assembly protein PilF